MAERRHPYPTRFKGPPLALAQVPVALVAVANTSSSSSTVVAQSGAATYAGATPQRGTTQPVPSHADGAPTPAAPAPSAPSEEILSESEPSESEPSESEPSEAPPPEAIALVAAPPASPSTPDPSATPVRKRTRHKPRPRAPSTDQDILDCLDERRCEHPIHPAYASTYPFNLCPTCLTKKRIRAVRVAEFTIINHGGKKPWREQVESMPETTEPERTERRKKAWVYKSWTSRYLSREQGKYDSSKNMSLAQAKTLLMARKAKLDRQQDEKQSWEEDTPLAMREQSEQDVLRDPNLGSAAKALKHLSSVYRDGKIGDVERHAVEFHRKRARVMEVTTKPEYPKDWSRHEYADSDDEGPTLDLNAEQTAFADAYALQQGDPPEYGSKWAQPLKRRKLDGNVRVALNSHIYVRKGADVDLLFSCPEGLTAEFLEDATSVPAPNSLIKGSRHIKVPPKKPHDVQKLEIEGRNTAEVGWVRSVPEPGYARTDTSGDSKTLDDWNKYHGALRAEAEEPNFHSDFDADSDTTEEDPELAERFLPLNRPDEDRSPTPGDLNAEMQTAREIAGTEWQIQQAEVRQRAQRLEDRTREIIAEIQEVIAQSPRLPQSAPRRRRRQNCSPSPAPEEVHAQKYAELAAQPYRDAVWRAMDMPQGEFRPHGGMASALVFGSCVGGAAAELLHRYGIL